VKRWVLVAAALAAAAGALVIATIAPARLTLTPWSDGTIPGVLHIHTSRSDGRSSPDDIAAAAARAGLKFIAFTDHGDGTRAPDPPVYRSGVLCLDGVEVSTTGGHYAALDMPAAPYPLGGEARDVVEDVRRLGGFGIAAHPDSPKPELRWREWTAPFDAIELINPDTSWRIGLNTPAWRPRLRLFASLVDYPFRSPETLASLLQHPTEVLTKWENLTQRRHVVGLAGIDAHAKLTPRNADPGDNRWSLPFPGYETAFRMLSVHVRPDRALTGDAKADAALILHALRSGHVFTAIDGIASPPSFEFSARNARGAAQAGDDLSPGGPVTLRVRSNAPPEFTTVVWQNSRVLSTGHHEQDFTVQAPDSPAVYWTEIVSTGRKRQIAWIISNPIYVRAPEPAAKLLMRPPPAQSASIFDGTTNGWRVERDPASQATIETGRNAAGPELQLRYALANEPSAGPFVALINDRPTALATNDRLAFTIRADHPMRISVQLRAGEPSGERWQRSVYIDAVDQDRTVYFDDLTPVGVTQTWRPTFSNIHDLLFVIDTTNSKPGSSGRLWIKSAALQR
jgi:hypothetical protein